MSSNYVLGRGKVYFDRFAPGTKNKTGERYFGNTPEITYNTESETLDHFNSDAGIRQKDDQAILEITRTLTFIGDDITADNMALFFLADVSTQVQAALTGQTTVYATIVKDRHYQIGVTTGNPTGVRNVTAVVVEPAAGGTPYTLGTDYTLDAALGRIYIPATSNIVPASGVEITYNQPATTREQIITANNTSVEGALRYVSDNPKGRQRDLYFPFVQLRPNGDFALKGDEWMQLPFTGEVLKLNDITAAAYIDGRPAA
jgi:hypothetical protein